MPRLTILFLLCLTLTGCGWLVCRTYEEPWTCKSRGWLGIVGIERGQTMCEEDPCISPGGQEHGK